MLKTIFVLRRKPGMTLEEFQTYWHEQHAPLVKRHAGTLGIKCYIQVHSRPGSQPRRADPLRGEMLKPFDGVAELWIDGQSATGSDEERRAAAQALAEDEARFIDFKGSSLWRGEEQVIIDGSV